MRISDKGKALIEEFEGCKLTAYKCPAGVWTIGVGHTGSDVKPGLTITRDQALALLAGDCRKFEDAVRKLVTVPINQNQFDALVSLAFNIGSHALAGSTLLKRLNAGDYTGAASQFGVWDKATVGGRKVTLKGLTRRRTAETGLFLSGVQPVPAPTPASPESGQKPSVLAWLGSIFKKGR